MVDALAVTKGEPAKYPLLEIKMLTESGETHYHLAVNESAVKRVSHTLEADVYINDQLFEKLSRRWSLRFNTNRFDCLWQITRWCSNSSPG